MTTDAQTRVEPDIPDPHHRDVTGGWLRPAVFGISDGLVSNDSFTRYKIVRPSGDFFFDENSDDKTN